jgi:hypothetical protein
VDVGVNHRGRRFGPDDGGGVEEAGDALAGESAVESGVEGSVCAAVAEEDLMRRIGGWGGQGRYVSAWGLEERGLELGPGFRPRCSESRLGKQEVCA